MLTALTPAYSETYVEPEEQGSPGDSREHYNTTIGFEIEYHTISKGYIATNASSCIFVLPVKQFNYPSWTTATAVLQPLCSTKGT